MADGVEDGVESPVQATEQQQQEQNGQRLRKLPHLPEELQGLSGPSSPALHGALSAASALAPRGLQVDARACPHGLLTTFLISEACTEGLQGKMTVFSSALRSASNVRLPWIGCPASEGHQGPLPLPLCPPGV